MAPSSLVALPFDIIYAINEHAYNAGRQHDLAVLSRVSKLFNEAATPWLYRTVTLDFMKPIDDSKCLKTLELARHCFRIKELKVIGLFPMADYAPLLDLIELIPWLPNLQRFR